MTDMNLEAFVEQLRSAAEAVDEFQKSVEGASKTASQVSNDLGPGGAGPIAGTGIGGANLPSAADNSDPGPAPERTSPEAAGAGLKFKPSTKSWIRKGIRAMDILTGTTPTLGILNDINQKVGFGDLTGLNQTLGAAQSTTGRVTGLFEPGIRAGLEGPSAEELKGIVDTTFEREEKVQELHKNTREQIDKKVRGAVAADVAQGLFKMATELARIRGFLNRGR